MKKIIENYKGLPKEVWFFALMTVINRMGAMVVPFLSKYLYEDLHFSYAQIGTIMLCFGLGSLFGTYLGGMLSKFISTHKIMVFSMFFSGLLLLGIQYCKDFYLICIVLFIFNAIADMFRPATTATLKDYVPKADRVRSFALLRTASNFGFLVSPVIAGVVITSVGYYLLFYIDGISSLTAILIFVLTVKEKKKIYKLKLYKYKEEKYAFFKDKLLLIHCLITILTGFVFFQVFTILPLYYTDVLKLDTSFNSVILVFYGLLLFLFEISIVAYIKRKGIETLKTISYGLLFMAIGYLLLFFIPNHYFVFIAVGFISFGVMFSFPFTADFVLDRAFKKQEGKFLSYFQMSYAIASTISVKIGMFIIDEFGYQLNFFINMVVALIGFATSYLLIKMVNKEKIEKREEIVKSIFK